jgi:hypothetical protein
VTKPTSRVLPICTRFAAPAPVEVITMSITLDENAHVAASTQRCFFCFAYPTMYSTSWRGSPSPNTCSQPPRVSMYSRIRHTLPSRTSNTKQ